MSAAVPPVLLRSYFGGFCKRKFLAFASGNGIGDRPAPRAYRAAKGSLKTERSGTEEEIAEAVGCPRETVRDLVVTFGKIGDLDETALGVFGCPVKSYPDFFTRWGIAPLTFLKGWKDPHPSCVKTVQMTLRPADQCVEGETEAEASDLFCHQRRNKRGLYLL
jgi:hypothetical protein